MNTNFSWEYDAYSRHYIVHNARLLFVNFSGSAQTYNQEGRRNFRVEIPDDMADRMESEGIYVRRREVTEDDGTVRLQNLIKISVYPDAEIKMFNGRNMTNAVISNKESEVADMGPMIDNEFRKQHISNGEINMEFHISKNSQVPASSPYLRVDYMVLPIRRSRLAEEYAKYEDGNYSDSFDDELPM